MNTPSPEINAASADSHCETLMPQCKALLQTYKSLAFKIFRGEHSFGHDGPNVKIILENDILPQLVYMLRSVGIKDGETVKTSNLRNPINDGTITYLLEEPLKKPSLDDLGTIKQQLRTQKEMLEHITSKPHSTEQFVTELTYLAAQAFHTAVEVTHNDMSRLVSSAMIESQRSLEATAGRTT